MIASSEPLLPSSRDVKRSSCWNCGRYAMWTLFLLLLLFAAIIIGSICLLIHFQESIIFQPTLGGPKEPDQNPYPFQNPLQQGMPYLNLTLVTRDNVAINAWHIARNDDYESLPTVIFFQGNAQNMGYRLKFLRQLHDALNVNILAVSYRGYGYSSGTPSEEGIYADAEAALQYLLTRTTPSNIILFGRSLGGAVAINLAHRHPSDIRAVIVENTFTSIKDNVPFPYLQPLLGRFLRVKMDSLELVPSLNMAMLFISGCKDEIIPPWQMMVLYINCKSMRKTLLKIPDGFHNDSWTDPRYIPGIEDFLRELYPGHFSEKEGSKAP